MSNPFSRLSIRIWGPKKLQEVEEEDDVEDVEKEDLDEEE